jgi:hypothetical protein
VAEAILRRVDRIRLGRFDVVFLNGQTSDSALMGARRRRTSAARDRRAAIYRNASSHLGWRLKTVAKEYRLAHA